MPIVALNRVNCRDALGDLGDRYSSNIQSCVIANEEWHIEANYHFGSIGDVSVYRNMNANKKNLPDNWQWYGAIPTANIKSYSLMEPAAPQALPTATPVEPQAAPPKKETSAAAVAAQR